MNLYEGFNPEEKLEEKFKEIKVKNRNYYPFLFTIFLTLFLSVIFYFASYNKVQFLFDDKNTNLSINNQNNSLNNDTKDIEEKDKITNINTTDTLASDNEEENNSDNTISDKEKEKEKEKKKDRKRKRKRKGKRKRKKILL